MSYKVTLYSFMNVPALSRIDLFIASVIHVSIQGKAKTYIPIDLMIDFNIFIFNKNVFYYFIIDSSYF